MRRAADLIAARPTLAVALFYLAAAVLFFVGALWPPSGQVLAGHDMLAYYYRAWDTAREGLRAGQLTLWEPGIFGGFPFLAQPQQNTFYPPNWINVLLPTRVGVTWLMLFHVWLAGFGLYLFARRRWRGGRRQAGEWSRRWVRRGEGGRRRSRTRSRGPRHRARSGQARWL